MSGFAIPTAAPRAWLPSDFSADLQRARLRLAPLATRAMARAAAHCPAIDAYKAEWIGYDSRSLDLLAAQLGGYADALEDVAVYHQLARRLALARRAWALVSGLASLQRAIERRAGK